jgi:Putative prokaryotic signal transducing protein
MPGRSFKERVLVNWHFENMGAGENSPRLAVSCIEVTGGTMASKPQPDQELVEVFDTDQESEAMVVRGLLESAGIDAIQTGLDAPQDILPGVGGVVLRVPASQADAARELIEEYRAGGTAAAEEAEINSEDPSAQ